MNKITFDDILAKSKDDMKQLKDSLLSLQSEASFTKTIIGVDLYEYSKMIDVKQFSVPFVIDTLFKNTNEKVLIHESLFFSKEEIEKIAESYIGTGDGFYIALNNPLKALIYLCHFRMEIEEFQTRNKAYTFMRIVEDFVFRFSIATGKVFIYENKYFGDAIIRCARIMAKDKLNRCLLDKDTLFWFYENGNGIESLQEFTLDEIKTSEASISDPNGTSLLFPKATEGNLAFKTIIASKIGKIEVKQDGFDVYNLFVQMAMRLGPANGKSYPFVTSLGTTNTNGL